MKITMDPNLIDKMLNAKIFSSFHWSENGNGYYGFSEEENFTISFHKEQQVYRIFDFKKPEFTIDKNCNDFQNIRTLYYFIEYYCKQKALHQSLK